MPIRASAPAIEGHDFRFELPSTWHADATADRPTFLGPQGAEVLLSASHVTGSGPHAEAVAIRESLLANAERSMLEASAHPDLTAATNVERVTSSSGGRFLRLDTSTIDGAVRFAQFAVPCANTVVLISYEAPTHAHEDHRDLLRAIDLLTMHHATSR